MMKLVLDDAILSVSDIESVLICRKVKTPARSYKVEERVEINPHWGILRKCWHRLARFFIGHPTRTVTKSTKEESHFGLDMVYYDEKNKKQHMAWTADNQAPLQSLLRTIADQMPDDMRMKVNQIMFEESP